MESLKQSVHEAMTQYLTDAGLRMDHDPGADRALLDVMEQQLSEEITKWNH